MTAQKKIHYVIKKFCPPKKFVNWRHCVKLGSHVPYVHRHVVPSAVSLAGVNTRHRQSRLSTACKRCPLPRAGETGFLQISAEKVSYNTYMIILLYWHDDDALGVNALFGFHHGERSAAQPACPCPEIQ